MVGIRGAKLRALRLGGGVLGAAALALALPVSNGIGPFHPAAPKPTEAALIGSFNGAFGPGEHERPASGPEAGGTVLLRTQGDAHSATVSDLHGNRTSDSLSGTG